MKLTSKFRSLKAVSDKYADIPSSFVLVLVFAFCGEAFLLGIHCLTLNGVVVGFLS